MPPYAEQLHPMSINTPLALLTLVGFFMRGADGGLFRFSNMWGTAFVMFAATMSSGFEYPIGDVETSAKLGFAAGAMYAVFPEIKLLRPIVSRKYYMGIGGFYMAYHGGRYIREKMYYENANETD